MSTECTAPAYLAVSSSIVYRMAPFHVCLVARSDWMQQMGVTPDGIHDAARSSQALLHECEEQMPPQPCAKCCRGRGLPNLLLDHRMLEVPSLQPGTRTFLFDRCISFCNSSRLHLGGRLVIEFVLRSRTGAVALRVLSEPILLQSKTTCRAAPRSPKSPKQAKCKEVESPEKAREPVVPVLPLTPQFVCHPRPRDTAEVAQLLAQELSYRERVPTSPLLTTGGAFSPFPALSPGMAPFAGATTVC
eukprot:m51a1_g1363 hypothetical protein (246) ;mRNA; r:397197-398258